MKRESFQGILLGVVIMCAVFAFITIAWAAFSSTLTISGSAKVAQQTWKVQFTNLDGTAISANTAIASPVYGGISEAPATDPLYIKANALDVEGNIGTINASGDKITYIWMVKNFGTFDAKVATDDVLASTTTAGSNINITCTNSRSGDSWTSTGFTSAQDFCDKKIKATLSVSNDGTSWTLLADGGSSPKYSFDLDKDGGTQPTKRIKLEVEFNGSNANETAPVGVDVAIGSGSPAKISFAATQRTS